MLIRTKNICLFMLLALVSQQALANQNVTLMLDWFINPNHGPIIIAQQQGLFKAAGLDVDIQQPAEPSMPEKLVAAGKVDIAVSYPNILIEGAAQGLPVERTASLISTPLNAMIVLDKSGINSLKDLAGKKIGVSISGNEEASINTMLKNAGVDPKSVQLINVGWALSASLASGRVDAIWGGQRNFELNQLALQGFPAKAFYPEEHGVPSFDELIFVANKNKLNKQVINKFNHALAQATLFIINHPQQAWQQFVSYDPQTLNTPLNKKAWQDTLGRFARRPAAVSLERYQNYAEFLLDNHVIKSLPPVNSYVMVD
ncbi:ABC transporter substrate-binding protein [Shewanella marina]|uniref:ABC transporter substrate-binding protein n=1 Tax=Shewanella marina TaxID=487319 RepID=UPI00046EB77A|nr:ABC transporter substrate-binding protein [Shewanella marina]